MLTLPPQVPLTSHRPSGLKLKLLLSPGASSRSATGGLDRSLSFHRLITQPPSLFAASQRPSGLNAMEREPPIIGKFAAGLR